MHNIKYRSGKGWETSGVTFDLPNGYRVDVAWTENSKDLKGLHIDSETYEVYVTDRHGRYQAVGDGHGIFGWVDEDELVEIISTLSTRGEV